MEKYLVFSLRMFIEDTMNCDCLDTSEKLEIISSAIEEDSWQRSCDGCVVFGKGFDNLYMCMDKYGITYAIDGSWVVDKKDFVEYKEIFLRAN